MPNIYAGVAGLSLIEETGVPAIEAHVRGLNTRLIDGLDELGATVVTPPTRRGADRSSACARPMRPRSSPRSPRSGSSCSLRDENLRVAAHLYNTDEDIDVLLEALSRRRSLLA